MKKFLTAAVIIILAVFLLDTAYYRWGFYVNFSDDKEIHTFTGTKGKEILVDAGDGMKPFEIKGVDIGAGIPGHFATEYAIDKETYLRWFGQITEMGANTIRVYTILSPAFYEAVYEYNDHNPDPLYIIHGVWVDDYIQNSHVDAYDDQFLETFKEDCRSLVDILHGRKKLNLGYGTTNTSGSYTKDISPWVLGYILGVEWESMTVAYTDRMQDTKGIFNGKYMYTTENASPFEALLAEVGDQIIAYETGKYKEQRLVAFSNWPTTDPLEYPELVDDYFMKCAQIDVEHIHTTDAFLSGQFASYHVYPYHPDYLRFYDGWKALSYMDQYKLENGGYNTYAAYLDMLNRHHDMPVVISEFGVPTSRGLSQIDYNTGRSQGHMSEKEQGEALVQSYQDIKQAGCAGSIIFSWQDEWFKRTWNTMANVDLSKTAYWSDYQTNEQFFGILTFDPGKTESVCYTDGNVEEWSKEDVVISQDQMELSVKYDEKFLYFRVHKEGLSKEGGKLYIPIDVTPKTGSYYAREEKLRFERPADFLMILDGKENSRVLVQDRYEAFKANFAEDFGEGNPYFDPPEKDSPVFKKIYLGLQMGKTISAGGTSQKAEKTETGKLVYGNGNPKAEDFNSVSDFMISGDDIEIRLPWQLLNFSNPSEMQVHDDYYEKSGIENLAVREIYAGIGAEAKESVRIQMGEVPLKGWGKNPASHERLKQSYYAVQKMWAE